MSGKLNRSELRSLRDAYIIRVNKSPLFKKLIDEYERMRVDLDMIENHVDRLQKEIDDRDVMIKDYVERSQMYKDRIDELEDFVDRVTEKNNKLEIELDTVKVQLKEKDELIDKLEAENNNYHNMT